MINIYDLLIKNIDKTRVLIDESMSKHTSFKIGGPADFLVNVETLKELQYILEIVQQHEIPLTVIGNGTNLLVKDRRNKRNCSTIAF